MNRRLAIIALCCCLLAVTAGCLGGGVDREAVARDHTYDWQTPADATINITGTTYYAIYTVQGNETLEVYERDEIGSEYPVSVAAVQFRYPNGTVVNASKFTVEQRGSRTAIVPPADGKIAYTATTAPKSFGTPIFSDGSYEVILPGNMEISLPLLGIISPGGYTVTRQDGRVHVRWERTPTDAIHLRYYLQRDFYIFAGLLVGLLLLGGGGIVYYRLRIRELERARRDAGLDVED